MTSIEKIQKKGALSALREAFSQRCAGIRASATYIEDHRIDKKTVAISAISAHRGHILHRLDDLVELANVIAEVESEIEAAEQEES